MSCLCLGSARLNTHPPGIVSSFTCSSGRTLVIFQAQRKSFLWDRGCSGGTQEIFRGY